MLSLKTEAARGDTVIIAARQSNGMREAFGQKQNTTQASTVVRKERGESKRGASEAKFKRRVTASPGVPDQSADATPLPYLFLFRRRLEPLALSVLALPSSCSFSLFLRCEQLADRSLLHHSAAPAFLSSGVRAALAFVHARRCVLICSLA
jgi:hypothetical protein